MHHVEFQFLEQVVRALELFVGFAGKADDDVGGDADVRDAGANLIDERRDNRQRCSRASCVSSTSSSPACTGTSICSQTLGKFRNGIEQFVVHVIGMRGEKADAFDAVNVVKHAQQFGETRTIGDVVAVAVDDLSQGGSLL